MKPVINLDELELESYDKASFGGRFGVISDRIGARKLGYNLSILPPGKKSCPFHNHHNNEEMFLVLEGAGTLRFGENEYPLRKHDVVACPPGAREVAHQILNTGDTDLVYLALSTRERTDVVEYPDSNKVAALVGEPGTAGLRAVFHAEQSVDPFDRES